MIELVWDAERSGTALTPSGVTARVGDEASFSPDDLLEMAVGGCLMRTFLALVAQARLSVLSYASTAALAAAAGGPRVLVHSYVVTPSTAERDRLLALFDQAKRASRMCGLLGDRVTCEAHVQIIEGAPEVS